MEKEKKLVIRKNGKHPPHDLCENCVEIGKELCIKRLARHLRKDAVIANILYENLFPRKELGRKPKKVSPAKRIKIRKKLGLD